MKAGGGKKVKIADGDVYRKAGTAGDDKPSYPWVGLKEVEGRASDLRLSMGYTCRGLKIWRRFGNRVVQALTGR